MPNEKRARQKAFRQAKMAELRRAQQRRRNLKRGGVVGIFVVIAVVLALVTSGAFDSGHHKTKVTAGKTSASTTTTTSPSATTTTIAGVPLSASALDADLDVRTPPAKSSMCANPATSTSTAPTTTVPASGNAVSIVAAPADVGFPNLDGSSPRYTKFGAAPPFCIDVDDTYTATMKTTAGTITITLLPKYAPVTVNSFVFLAGYHYYDGVVFQRVIPGFMDQGGDPTGTGSGGPGYTVPDEYPKTAGAYDAGAVAMANTGQPNTGGSQFFLVDGNGGQELGSPTYTVFGQITAGLSVADKINAGGNASPSANGEPPKTTYKIESISITATPTS